MAFDIKHLEAASYVLTADGANGYIRIAGSTTPPPTIGTIVSLTTTGGPSKTNLQITNIGGVAGSTDIKLTVYDFATKLAYDASAFLTSQAATVNIAEQSLWFGVGEDGMVSDRFTDAQMETILTAIGLVTGGGGGGTTVLQGTSPWVVSGTVAVTGTFWQATQPISATSLPLPTGAATQVTLASVLAALQGSLTATVSGSVTANIGTTNGLALDATLTGGTAKSINRGGAKGATTAADVTSTANGADHQALDVWLNNTSIAVTGTVTANAGTGNFTVTQATGTNLHVVVDSAPSTTVTGSVTANIGTSGSLALDASVTGLQVSQGSTTSGQKGDLVMGAVTTAAPSYTTAQTSPLSLTTAGLLRSTLPNLEVAQGSTTSGEVGPLVQGAVTTAAPSYTTAQTSPLSLTTAGNLRVVALSDVGQGSTTSGQSGALVQGAVTTSAPSYTTAQTSPLSLTTGGLLRGTTPNLELAQGSTTSGQVGPLLQGAVTTAAPSYTTAQTSPLSLTTAGRLRTDPSGVSLTVVGSGAAGSALSGNPVLVAGSDATNARTLLTDTSGRLMNVGAAAAGSAIAGNPVLVGGSDGTNARAIKTDTAGVVRVALAAQSDSGCSTSRTLSASGTNSTNVKNAAGVVLGWHIFNTTTSTKFVKLYNKATAPTVGSDTPVETLCIPASGGNNLTIPAGINFSLGIGFAITGAVGDADTTSVATNDVVLNLFYN